LYRDRRVSVPAPPVLPPGVEMEISLRARRISLRLDAAAGVVRLVVPRRVSLARAAAFAALHKIWIGRKLAALPQAIPFADGVEIPVGGLPHVIRHRPGMRGTVWLEEGEIHVAGAPEHLPRRVTDWLKAEARRRIQAAIDRFSAEIGRRPSRVVLRDTTSRWGSCSPTGRLAFSWRLVLAPEAVLTYVVAHEVAHLIELNHGPRFWRLVQTMVPGYDAQRNWLTVNGARLHRYG